MPSADNFSSSTGNGRAVQVRRSRKFEGRRSTNGTIGNRLFLSVVWTERAVMVSALSSFIVAILCRITLGVYPILARFALGDVELSN